MTMDKRVVSDVEEAEGAGRLAVQEVRQEGASEEDLRLLARWNATQHSYPRELSLAQLIGREAAARPEALALSGEGRVLTYGELNRRANQVAQRLREVGVGIGALVGICLPRSLDLVVGLLGIWRAGGAYLPLDPVYPAARKRFMLEDARISVLLTYEYLLADLPAEGCTVICLDRDARDLQRQAESEPEGTSSLDARAYVIYTSGSTGQPKGVEVSQANLLNLIYWHRRAYGVSAADRATQVTSPAFDATGWELWPYLSCGASVHFPDEETRVAPSRLRDWLLDQRITISFLPTALAESMLTLDWPQSAALRYLLTGADTLKHYPPASLPFAFVNNYGPTETTVVATFGIVPPDGPSAQLPSIGRPIDNTQIYLLDAQMRQVPPGIAGELYIGGEGVALGYLNRPELTRERFVPDPLSPLPGARLYKTGDMARYLADGQIAFLGRADYQIKIRGYRIEPDEITAVLNSHPAIQNSVIVAREKGGDEKELVAYIVADPTQEVTLSELQTHLGSRLPAYMVPASFVLLDVLPATANGKVDRAALPVPSEENMLKDQERVLPATPLEERLEELVAARLELAHVSVEDNFFMLGGHSLLGTQIATHVSTTFGINLPLRSLFEAPTVRLLAARIEELLMEKIASMSEEEAQKMLS